MRGRRTQTAREQPRARAVRLRRRAGARGGGASRDRLRNEAGVESLVRGQQPDEDEADREQRPGRGGRDRLDALLGCLLERLRPDEHARAEEASEELDVLRGGIDWHDSDWDV